MKHLLIIFSLLAIAVMAISVVTRSRAQMMETGIGPGDQGGGVLTPCSGGQLDLSVATGCNATFYMTGTI